MIWIGPGLDLTIWCSKPMLALWSENLVADSEAAILRMQIQGFYKLSFPGSIVGVKIVP